MKNPYDIIRSILKTEKSSRDEALGKYLFSVDPQAGKHQIKDAVERIFKVTVRRVNTVNVAGKKRRVRYALGYRPDTKKALVTLKAGDKIDTTL